MKTEIVLEDLTFYGYHGFYEEERKAGNRFSVDLKITTDLDENIDFDHLPNTINYEDLYEVVKNRMNVSSKLLENLAKKILDDIFLKWSSIVAAEVSISKYSPPIGGPCKRTKVTLSKVK